MKLISTLYRQMIGFVRTCPAQIAISHEISSSYTALTVQISIIWDWAEPWTVLSILSLRNPNTCPQEARACPHQGVLPCMRRNNVMANCAMHRQKQTLWLIQENSKRKGEKIKNKALLTRLMNEITLCHPGEEARGMAQRVSTDETVDLSGNKEPRHWGASAKVSRKAWPCCAFERIWL